MAHLSSDFWTKKGTFCLIWSFLIWSHHCKLILNTPVDSKSILRLKYSSKVWPYSIQNRINCGFSRFFSDFFFENWFRLLLHIVQASCLLPSQLEAEGYSPAFLKALEERLLQVINLKITFSGKWPKFDQKLNQWISYWG